MSDSVVQTAVKAAAQKAGIHKPVSFDQRTDQLKTMVRVAGAANG